MTIEAGSSAPDFELTDQHGQKVKLSDFRGRSNVALVFYPFAFSGICTGELCEIRDNLELFTAGDVQVLAISCDPMFSLRAYADKEGYDFPLLSDFWPHGAVAQAYGVFDESRGRADRGTFLIDREGVVRWSVVNAPGQARPLAAYREAVAAL
ncbi:MAG: peroxiredoxin [Kineosporiaceae bacterium]|jgi:peroxiredoxin (alkyl hydroperoxide reductase subunit C)